MRKLGLEWLWRIKEEPHLWARYWHDGLVLLRLLCLRVLPLVIYRIHSANKAKLSATIDDSALENGELRVKIRGPATLPIIEELVRRCSVAVGKQVVFDLSNTSIVDSRFLGFLLVLRNSVGRNGGKLRLVGLSRSVQRQFRLNGVEFLLQSEAGVTRLKQGKSGNERPGTVPEKMVLEAVESL
jgi:N-acetylglucosaminyldiphosphoundecaprenol N-acetyl-beta-D-mannosaminyltransferase